MKPNDLHIDDLDTLEIEQLRAAARARGLKRRDDDGGAIPRAARGAALPLSFMQQGLWVLAQMAPDSGAYHIAAALRLCGRLDRPALRRALDAIVARHEALRSLFVLTDGEPRVNLLPPDIGLPLIEHDLRRRTDAEAQLARISREEERAPFDLAGGPLIRGRLIQLKAQEHVLLITQHHIVSDGWSEGLFARELALLYGAFRDGASDPLPPLPIQYPDYAAWQRRWLTGDQLRRQSDYWRQALDGAPARLELPTDRARPSGQSFAGAYLPIALDRELTQAVRDVSARHGVTPFMTALSAWAIVLARLSGQEDIVIGIPAANRRQPETEGLIGCFVNTMALRLDLRGAADGADLLARVRAATVAAQDHQELPFEQVVEIVQPPRQPNHNPLFQVLCSWQNDRALPALPGLSVASARTSFDIARYDLKLDLNDPGETIAGGFIYATALFDEATIVRHRGYLLTALRAIVDDPARPIRHIDLAGPEERSLREAWNATDASYPSDRCLYELFEAQARLTPDAPAVEYDGRTLSYAQLEAAASRLARRLTGLGVQEDDRVALAAERSLATIVGWLAILQAGGAYVPLDPAYPRDRLVRALADAECRIIVADAAARDALGPDALRERTVIDLHGFAENTAPPAAPAASDPDDAPRGLTPRRLAYVIYTSGSTGTPKGVMIEHRSVINFHTAMSRTIYPPAASPRRIGWNASFAFDMSIKGLSRLLAGDCLVIIPQAVRASGAALRAWLDEARIDAFDTTPSQLKGLIAAGFLSDPAPRTVLVGGEAIEPAMWTQLQRAAALTVYNMYGPTECTVDATIGRVAPDDGGPHIGTPVANMRVYLLDERLQPTLLGAVGEIYIGGVGVARGYWRQPELTEERFLRDPFSASPDARMYKTGDLARVRADGRLQYVGRNDQQVKIRGFRIELGEIEARLAAHPAVREAVVLARTDESAEPRLVAYIQQREPRDAPDGWAGTLRAHLAASLPEHMLPAAFVRIDRWPVTPNGKLDRDALPAPDAAAYAHHEYAAPRGAVEERLAELWQELLGVDRVGRNDHFFELGGHSLLAVQLLVRMRDALRVQVSMATLFARPSLAQLAEAVADLGGADALAARAPIPAIPRDGALPLSFEQQRLWFLAQLDEASAITYHIPAAMRLRGDVNRTALRRALDAILARHDALRSIFVATQGEPRVELLPPGSGLPLIEHDLRAEPDADALLATIAVDEAHAPFDLAGGPLIRARLIRMGPAEHVLLVTMHHLVSDGWSLRIFAEELGALYRAFAEGARDPLPALPIQYPDYAAWQRRWLSGDRLRRQAEYWRETLAGAPALLELPTDRPRPPAQSFAGAFMPITVGAEVTRALKELSANEGTTLFMTLLAGWAAVLSRLSGQDDLVIGIPAANRQRPETERLIGFFVNTLALRVDLADEPSVVDLLARVRATAVAAQDHQDLPFEQVVEIVQPPRRLNHTPLCQVMFSWHNDERILPDLPGLRVDEERMPYDMAKFDLRLDLVEQGDALVGGLIYSTALFDEETIRRHRGYLLTMLEAMAREPAQAIARIDLVGAEERALRDGWNATAAPYAADRCLHQLFEAQAARTPSAMAVVCEGQALRYGELNAAANRLAHHLIDLGVRPNDRVAICVERGVAMVAGVLAIVKAGGAYVPVDPAYPSARIGDIIADAEPRVVITDAVGRAVLGAAPLADRIVLDLDPLRPGSTTPPAWSARPDINPDAAALGLTSADLAYVIYTSGSTGTPKGVMGLHRPVVNLIEWIGKQFSVGSDDVVLLTSSLSFDLSVYDIFGLLAAGGCVRVASPREAGDPTALARLLFDERITFWDSAPAVFQQLLFALDEASCDGRVSALRLAFFSGDWIPLEFFAKLRQFFPGCRMIGLGGATEAAVWSNFYPVTHVDPAWVSIPYGRPIQNARYYVLDKHLHHAPIGARGDLYIGGDCLTAGYWHRPELTAERFVRDPWVGAPDARMYKTGDLARYWPDGNLEFLGRNDHQVKIRGFRVELGEIEARLAEHAAVSAAVVAAREDTPGEKRLVAYIVPSASERGETSPPAAEWAGAIRTYLAGRLPEYMVPAAYVRLAALPLTPNGKLDRAALPAPEDDAFARRAYEPPRGEVEETLARLWQELLGVAQVGRDDHFFELGGHSLLAVQLIERLRGAGLQLEVRSVFAAPVLSDVAARVDQVEEVRL